eukprot:CAMPEP_0182810222 /NCGR_PEP_ID=MMETSP0006_2-20121128/7612_1 /TAXON_ID=97485 /ORGANISM="Prymnesium parvum, Strain Texoma1" /LENGTH=84 /DNA_ID=CAMNT_0024936079 /DNA_START=386 /DNA_END=640 /DNA_ORIENTATION=+
MALFRLSERQSDMVSTDDMRTSLARRMVHGTCATQMIARSAELHWISAGVQADLDRGGWRRVKLLAQCLCKLIDRKGGGRPWTV